MKEHPAIKEKKDTLMVYQSNNLVEAIYNSDLSPLEHKLIRYAIAQAKKDPNNFPIISFSASEFLEANDTKSNNYVPTLRKMGESLKEKTISIDSGDGRKFGYITIVPSFIYDNGMIHLTFNELLRPYIMQLESEYTQYNYKYISNLQSSYSIRLFELLKQYLPIGRRKIEVETLKKMLGIVDKYQKYAQFKLRVLKQAQKELEEKKDFIFTFNEIKTGRKVTTLEFEFKFKNKKPVEILEHPLNEKEQFLKEARFLLENYPFEFSDDVLRSWHKYGIELLREVLDQVQHRKMDHPKAYVEKVLEETYKQNQEKQLTFEGLEEQSDRPKDKEIAKVMQRLVDKYTPKKGATRVEPLPDYFIEQEAIRMLEEIASKEEAKKIWDEYKESTLFLIESRRKRLVGSR